MNKTVIAKNLIDFIVSNKIEASVEDDEDLYVKPTAEIEVDEEGLCSLTVGTECGSSLDMGYFRIEAGDVSITVGRDIDGPKDDYEFEGVTIVYSDGVTQEDVIKAIKENVEFPEYDPDQYSDTDFDPDDVAAAVEVDEDSIFAEDDDGNIYCYDDEDEVPEDFSVIDADDAVAQLVENWVDEGGEVDGFMTESYGPWG
jgi:hypothetical protein